MLSPSSLPLRKKLVKRRRPNPSNVPPFFLYQCWTSERSDKNASHTFWTDAGEGKVIEIVFESSSEANLQCTTVTLFPVVGGPSFVLGPFLLELIFEAYALRTKFCVA